MAKKSGKKSVLMEKFQKMSNKDLITIMCVVAYLFVMFFCLHISTYLAKDPGANLLEFIEGGLDHMSKYPFNVTFTPTFFVILFFATIIVVFVGLFLHYDTLTHKPGEKDSAGSAKFNDDIEGYNKEFTDPKGEKNMILTDEVFLSMEGWKTKRNCNVLVIGGSGAGKSRFMVKPNLLQANCNYVITDPAGELLESTGTFFEKNGYEVKVFNLVEMQKSNRYNPFAYIRDDVGVLMMINCLIRNTNPDGKSGGSDPFWEKSETALLQALVFYLIKYRPKKEQNFTSVMKLLRAAEVDENNPDKPSRLDHIFQEVEARDPSSIAVKQYKTFKMGAGKTLKSILISTSVRLTVFNMKQIENLTKTDDIDLGGMGFGNKVLFVIIPAADSTYNFLVSMMYSQLFETLYYVAETDLERCAGKRLPRHVRFMLDEFANIGQIPEFTKKLATMRKYEISCTIILQNLAQIKTMYKDDWESIVGNCDTMLFLGGQEQSTLKYVSEQIGKRTVRTVTRSRGRGKNGSPTDGEQLVGRDVMTPDELARMDNSLCITIVRGLYPFKTKKYDYPRHPNYKFTGDADKKLIYINTRDNTVPQTKKEKDDIHRDAEVAIAEKEALETTMAINSKDPHEQILSAPLSVKEICSNFAEDGMESIMILNVDMPLISLPDENQEKTEEDNNVVVVGDL